MGKFVADRMPVQYDVVEFGRFSAIGVSRGYDMIAGFVYHTYQGWECELTMASDDPSWCRSRTIISTLFAYPFLQLGCTRMNLNVCVNNEKAIKLGVGLGFKIEGLKRRGYDGVNDAYVMGMLREECIWINRGKR